MPLVLDGCGDFEVSMAYCLDWEMSLWIFDLI